MIELSADGCLCDLRSGKAGACTCNDPLDLSREDQLEISIAKLKANETKLPSDRARVDQLVTAALARKNAARHRSDSMGTTKDACKKYSVKFDSADEHGSALRVLDKLGLTGDHLTADNIPLRDRSLIYLESRIDCASQDHNYTTLDTSDEIDEQGNYRYDADDTGPSGAEVAAQRNAVRYQAFQIVSARHRNDGVQPAAQEVELEVDRLVAHSKPLRKPIKPFVAARHHADSQRSSSESASRYKAPAVDPAIPVYLRDHYAKRGGK